MKIRHPAKFVNKLQSEVRIHRFVYLLLLIILSLGLFLRVYRVDQVLGFYFDQGRDALVIWDFWHNGKLFLVGPTTGIAGIFRGPLYYYLIAPFYLIGGGDPVWPAIFLALISVLAIGLIYYLGQKIQNKATGILAALIASFSFYIILASRWLSNPTPMLLLSMLLVLCMCNIADKRAPASNALRSNAGWWYAISLIVGISLFHFGSSGEFFYLPALFIFAIWQRKTLTKKIVFICGLLFFITASPLLVFDIRHDGILSNNIKEFLFDQGSFKPNFWDVLPARLNFFYKAFTNKIFHWMRAGEILILRVTAISFLLFLPKYIKNSGVKILILLLISPVVGLIFFQGNSGNIYDYYLTGYYLIFVLLFAVVLGNIWQFKLGKLFIGVFVFFFLRLNLDVTWYKISDRADGPQAILFKNQKQAVEWIYEDAKTQPFSVDVYVPPVIPYAYDYLFRWFPTMPKLRVTGTLPPSTEPISPLYTLYEYDGTHFELQENWIKRQDGIGVVEKEARFGGITVQRRKRL